MLAQTILDVRRKALMLADSHPRPIPGPIATSTS